MNIVLTRLWVEVVLHLNLLWASMFPFSLNVVCREFTACLLTPASVGHGYPPSVGSGGGSSRPLAGQLDIFVAKKNISVQNILFYIPVKQLSRV